MRTLGMLGGMAWPSTVDAYRVINEEVGRRVGGVASAPLIVWSFDFAEIERLQADGDWTGAGRVARHEVHDGYDELVRGVIRDDSRAEYLRMVAEMESSGVEGIIAGCTEIELLVTPADVGTHYPTTAIHALAAVEWMLQQ